MISKLGLQTPLYTRKKFSNEYNIYVYRKVVVA